MTATVIQGDCRTVLRTLDAGSVQCCVTSPPYWGLRDYGTKDQLGLEPTTAHYIAQMLEVFRGVRRVLREDGTVWLNLGDSYSNQKSGEQGTNGQMAGRSVTQSGVRLTDRTRVTELAPKNLNGIPWRVALALQEDGWYLRQDIIWHKPNPMPESVTDRCTKAHEYLFLLTKAERYFYNAEAIKEPSIDDESLNGRRARGNHAAQDEYRNGDEKFRYRMGLDGDVMTGKVFATRNRRSVWTIPTSPYSEAHFATFPPDLIKPCILAGSKAGDTVLDPFGGSGTTGMVALEYGRKAVLIELNPAYVALCHERCAVTPGLAL